MSAGDIIPIGMLRNAGLIQQSEALPKPEFDLEPALPDYVAELESEINRPNWRAKLGRLAAAAILITGGYLTTKATSGAEQSSEHDLSYLRESSAPANFDNAAIADLALSYVGKWGGEACRDANLLDKDPVTKKVKTTVGGDNGGECKTFVNCIIYKLSGGGQRTGNSGSDYFYSFLREGGQEITSISNLARGDIIQEGKNTNDKLHTYIILYPKAGNIFRVVDSNVNKDKMVTEHDRKVALGSKVRAFRMGRVNTPPPSPAPPRPEAPAPVDINRFKGRIVQWSNGPDKPNTSWLVGWDGKRYWIPNPTTYWCLRNKGTPDEGVQPASVLDALPDQTGNHAKCFPTTPTTARQQISPRIAPAPSTPDTIQPVYQPAEPAVQHAQPVETSTTTTTTTTTTQPEQAPPPPPPPPQRYREQQGSRGADTFSDYHNASGRGPRRVDPAEWVEVECKIHDPYIRSNSGGYWYRIASSPWNSQYYAAASTFMNGDPWGGPYSHNVDENVPIC